MKRLNQTGSHILALLLLVVVLGVVAFAGYKVTHAKKQVAPAITKTASASVPGSINSASDLSQAANALDSSSAQLNSSLNDSALNNDLNDML